MSGGWLPIETAPKDGTEVLLFCPDDQPQIVSCKYWLGYSPGWMFTDDTLANIAEEGPENPTHWQPLPEPPGADQ